VGDAFVFKILDQVRIVPADEESPTLKIASYQVGIEAAEPLQERRAIQNRPTCRRGAVRNAHASEF